MAKAGTAGFGIQAAERRAKIGRDDLAAGASAASRVATPSKEATDANAIRIREDAEAIPEAGIMRGQGAASDPLAKSNRKRFFGLF